MASKPCCCLVGGVFSAIFFFIFLAIGIFSVGYLEEILVTKAAEGSALSPKNYQNWGQVPGNFDINVTRRYVFQNFQNPFEVFYFNETPRFVETRDYIYQEYQNAADEVYSENDTNGNPSIVDFNYQLYNLPLNTSPTDLVTTINLGAVGLWYTAHNLTDAEMAVIGFNALLESLALDIPTTTQGEGIQFQCVSTQDMATALLKVSNIRDPDLVEWMWSDPVMGLSKLSTLNNWVHAVADGPRSGAAQIIGDYFTLKSDQVRNLFQPGVTFGDCIQGLNTAIHNAYSCPTDPCTADYLVKLQWSGQNVTIKPAGGKVNPEPSVVYFNSTVVGFPEISYYLTENFTKTYDVDPARYNISFNIEMTEWLFNKTPSVPSKYNTNTDTLLNKANMEYLFSVGRAFDAQGDLTNLTLLEGVKDRFRLESLEQAHVLWKYMDYIQGEFILRESLQGGRGQVLIGEWAGTSLYLNFTTAENLLAQDLTATLTWNDLIDNSMGCPEMLVTSAGDLDLDQAATKCNETAVLSPWNLNSLKFVMEACTHQSSDPYVLLQNQTGFTNKQMLNLCGTMAPNSFASLLQSNQKYLKDSYNCTSSYAKSTKCSNYELAAKQWADSTITQNLPSRLQKNYTTVDSLAEWYPEIFPKPFEYRAVLKKLSKGFTLYNVSEVGLDRAKMLLSFDNLFGPTKVQSAFLFSENALWSNFSETFYGLDPYQLTSYLRYIMMDVALGGFSQTRTVQELLWGYNDPLLEYMKNRDPLKSGDPSVNTFISLGGQNSSSDDAKNFPVSMYTGMNDSAITRQIVSLYGQDTITYLNSYFNGNEVVSEYVTPWNGTIAFQGTDGSVDHPNLTTSDTPPLYIPELTFQTNLVYNGTNNTHHGLDTYSFRLASNALSNAANNSNNYLYFMDNWEGFINITKLHKAPLFVCKAHFLDADTTLANAVEVYNSDQSELVGPDRSEDFHMDIEPYTGVPLDVMAGFQANYEFVPDEFFTYPKTVMLPIVVTYRGTAFSEDQVDKAFGDLKKGLFVLNYGPWIGFGAAIIFAILCIFCFLRRRKLLQPTKEQKLAEEVSLYRRMASYETKPPIELIGGNNSSEDDITPVRDTKLFKWNQDKEEA